MRELIYKDEAFKAIDNCIRDDYYRISPIEAKMNIKYLVSDATYRPQGEWICKGDWAECSLCGADSGTIMDGLERVPRYTRFCPECGARMKGADDETTMS